MQTADLGQDLGNAPYHGRPQTIFSIGTNPAAVFATYSAEQTAAFDNLRGVVTNPTEHSLMFAVDLNDRFGEVMPLPNIVPSQQAGMSESLRSMDLSGMTVERFLTLRGNQSTSLVFVARNPVRRRGMMTIAAEAYEPSMHTLHEIGGHVFGAMQGIANTNIFAEQYETAFRQIFIEDFSVPSNFLGGHAPQHR